MAGQVRHLKVKDGRFYARIAVPAALRERIGRSELTAPLGGERRAALKLLPEAVAGLQRQLALAAPETSAGSTAQVPPRKALNVNQIALRSYTARLEQDTTLRERNTAWATLGIDTDYASRLRDGMAGKLSDAELAFSCVHCSHQEAGFSFAWIHELRRFAYVVSVHSFQRPAPRSPLRQHPRAAGRKPSRAADGGAVRQDPTTCPGCARSRCRSRAACG